MTQWLQKAYAMGDYKAYGVMGDVYYEGKGCMQNYSRAYTYYKVAEAHGDAHAKEGCLIIPIWDLTDMSKIKNGSGRICETW